MNGLFAAPFSFCDHFLSGIWNEFRLTACLHWRRVTFDRECRIGYTRVRDLARCTSKYTLRTRVAQLWSVSLNYFAIFATFHPKKWFGKCLLAIFALSLYWSLRILVSWTIRGYNAWQHCCKEAVELWCSFRWLAANGLTIYLCHLLNINVFSTSPSSRLHWLTYLYIDILLIHVNHSETQWLREVKYDHSFLGE